VYRVLGTHSFTEFCNKATMLEFPFLQFIKNFKRSDVQDPCHFSSLCGAYFNLLLLASRIIILLWSQ